ncbi:MAG: DUF554 domain-containing protein [Firmicutes bacterium HGW-Firmicutes-7]|nr:MAG: DUF554 domain-containing protein [Firmicutes bacterium HGW-Firmicutes-7]
MLGNFVNTAAIIFGCILGLLIKNGLKDKYKNTVMQGIGLSVLFIGTSSAISGLLNPESESILFILSLVIGGLIGEWIDIEKRLEGLGTFLQKKIKNGEHNISQGFVTASLIFCVGTMAIIGALESGLRNDHNMLFAKAVLDGITSIILTTTLGVGVIFSAVAVFMYQGLIVVFASTIEPYLSADIIREMSIVGGILIVGIGLSMLDIVRIKTANMLPAILVPALWYLVGKPLIALFL